MSLLKSLTFCAAPARLRDDPKLARRQNLINRLEEQRHLTKDPAYVVTTKRSARSETGEKVIVERVKKIHPWWKYNEKNEVILSVRVGFRTLEFEKGKSGIVVGKVEKLDEVLQNLILAVRSGELDHLLEVKKVTTGNKPAVAPKPLKDAA